MSHRRPSQAPELVKEDTRTALDHASGSLEPSIWNRIALTAIDAVANIQLATMCFELQIGLFFDGNTILIRHCDTCVVCCYHCLTSTSTLGYGMAP